MGGPRDRPAAYLSGHSGESGRNATTLRRLRTAEARLRGADSRTNGWLDVKEVDQVLIEARELLVQGRYG